MRLSLVSTSFLTLLAGNFLANAQPTAVGSKLAPRHGDGEGKLVDRAINAWKSEITTVNSFVDSGDRWSGSSRYSGVYKRGERESGDRAENGDRDGDRDDDDNDDDDDDDDDDDKHRGDRTPADRAEDGRRGDRDDDDKDDDDKDHHGKDRDDKDHDDKYRDGKDKDHDKDDDDDDDDDESRRPVDYVDPERGSGDHAEDGRSPVDYVEPGRKPGHHAETPVSAKDALRAAKEQLRLNHVLGNTHDLEKEGKQAAETTKQGLRKLIALLEQLVRHEHDSEYSSRSDKKKILQEIKALQCGAILPAVQKLWEAAADAADASKPPPVPFPNMCQITGNHTGYGSGRESVGYGGKGESGKAKMNGKDESDCPGCTKGSGYAWSG